MSDERSKRMSEERFEDLVLKGLHGSTWASDYRALEAEAVRARASEKRLRDTMKVISFLANQALAASREGDFAQVAEGLTVIHEHFRAALSEVEP